MLPCVGERRELDGTTRSDPRSHAIDVELIIRLEEDEIALRDESVERTFEQTPLDVRRVGLRHSYFLNFLNFDWFIGLQKNPSVESSISIQPEYLFHYIQTIVLNLIL